MGEYDGYLVTPDPSNAKEGCGILYLPDVIGIWQNSQLVADQFAANGYLTLIIDLFKGDAFSLSQPGSANFEIMAWLKKGSKGDNPHTKEYVDPIVVDAIKWMKDEKGITKLGAVGYCFGVKYIARHYKTGIQVGYMAHRSFVDKDDLAAFKAPLSIAAAETDQIFPAPLRHKSEEILAKGGNPYQINLYSQVEHGFSVRCDLPDKAEKWAKEQAFLQAVTWFDTWLV